MGSNTKQRQKKTGLLTHCLQQWFRLHHPLLPIYSVRYKHYLD